MFTKAFTLSEVLITLGIIGVVAALTMPGIIQKNANRVVETRLMKFYSEINQAVEMAEVKYGDKKFWYQDLKGLQIDDEGNVIEGDSESEKWFRKYLAPYMKILKIETTQDGSFMVYLADGSAFRPVASNTRDWIFYPGKPDKCIKDFGSYVNGRCSFAFNFMPLDSGDMWKYHTDKGFEPWKWKWDGTQKSLYEGCIGKNAGSQHTQYCTALIQYNNWKIPEDYPYKVSY